MVTHLACTHPEFIPPSFIAATHDTDWIYQRTIDGEPKEKPGSGQYAWDAIRAELQRVGADTRLITRIYAQLINGARTPTPELLDTITQKLHDGDPYLQLPSPRPIIVLNNEKPLLSRAGWPADAAWISRRQRAWSIATCAMRWAKSTVAACVWPTSDVELPCILRWSAPADCLAVMCFPQAGENSLTYERRAVAALRQYQPNRRLLTIGARTGRGGAHVLISKEHITAAMTACEQEHADLLLAVTNDRERAKNEPEIVRQEMADFFGMVQDVVPEVRDDEPVL